MSKERLEEINRNVLYIKKNSLTPNEIITWSGWKSILPIFTEDLEYLQEQANQVPELEKQLEKSGHGLYNCHMCYERLEQQNKRYREALEFYAGDDKWKPTITYTPEGDMHEGAPLFIEDGGEIARKALEGEE